MSAAEISLAPGTYRKTDVYDRTPLVVRESPQSDDTPDVLVLRQGNRVRLINQKTKEANIFDLENPAEQPGAIGGIEEGRKIEPFKQLFNAIDTTSASNFRVESPERVTGSYNVYLKNKSVFGSMRGHLRLGFAYEFVDCQIRVDDRALGGQVLVPGHCVREHIGTRVDVLSVTFDPRVNPFLGLILDTAFKIFSPNFLNENFYYRTN